MGRDRESRGAASFWVGRGWEGSRKSSGRVLTRGVGVVWFDQVMAGATDDDVRPSLGDHPAQGSTTAAVAQARDLVAAGSFDEARALLEPVVRDDRDPEALKLLGQALHAVGNLPGAGAVWFATAARGPAVEESVAAWRAFHHDDFAAMWRSLPRSVRALPHSPKVAALQAKAREVDSTIGSPQGSGAAEPKPLAARAEGSSVDREQAGPVKPQTETSTAGAAAAESSTRSSSRTETSTAGRPAAADAVTADRGMSDERRRRTGVAQPMDDRVESRPAAKSAEPQEGFDAAKFIGWVLAALFVLCAVVGLITILKWIVPGG